MPFIYKIHSDMYRKTYYGSSGKPELEDRMLGHIVDYQKWVARGRPHGRGVGWVASFKVLDCPDWTAEVVEEFDDDIPYADLIEHEKRWIRSHPCVNYVYRRPGYENGHPNPPAAKSDAVSFLNRLGENVVLTMISC